MAQSFKPEDTDSETKDRQPGMSRMKQLLARRNAHKQNRWVLSVKRQRLLDEAKEKIKRSEYEAARLSSRLDILNLVVDHALVDDSFLGKKELNPWRFKRPAMDRKYNFVNNMVTAQEMLVMVDEAKQRMRNQQEEKSNQEITEEERVKSTPKNDSTDDAEEDGENEKTLKDKNSKIPCQNVEETSNHVGVDIHKQSDKIESNDDNRENAKGVSSKKKLSPIISRSKSSKVNKLRKHKLKTTKANSNSATSSTIIYAFGSSHNKESCHYCGSVQCAGQLNRNRMNINGNNLTSIGQRISDLRGIYDKESWNSKYSKRIQERIKVIDGELNDKLVNSPSLILRHSKK